MGSDVAEMSLLLLEAGSLSVGLEAGLIVGLVLLCVFSFVTTLCEVAYRESSPTKLRFAYSKPQGRIAFRLIQSKDMVIMCNRLLDVLTTIAIVIDALFLGLGATGSDWLAVTLAILIAFLVAVVIGEVVPAAIAAQRPERVAVFMSYPMMAIFYLFYPLTFLFWVFSKAVKKVFHIQNQADVSEKELKALAMDAYREGSIEKEEHDLVLNALNFDDKTIGEIMVPRKNLSTADTSMSLESIERMFEETNYSRIPLLDANGGEFIGILYQKDFYEMRIHGQKGLKAIVKPALYMDASTNCSKALKRFQALRQHIALVRDSQRHVVGLVTVEDLLEELVGDIDDEYDAEDLERANAAALRKRSDRADLEEALRRKRQFTDTIILPSPEGEESRSAEEGSSSDDPLGQG